jgi:ArsR family transcriptional regulator, virulence genes transcriptional regulator
MKKEENFECLPGALGELTVTPGKVCRAARTLSLLSNPQRLRVLCHLVDTPELCVSQLLERLDISPSALSQHLARLREDEMVGTRREGLQIFYRIEREDVRRILQLLHELYCQSPAPEGAEA